MVAQKLQRPREAEVGPSGLAPVAYSTLNGVMYLGKAEEVLNKPELRKLRRKVQLIFTSPPFPLNRKKKYGNFTGDEYVRWLADFAPIFRDFLKKDGSIVLELGNAWEPGRPVMSTLAIRALLRFLELGEFSLCQQFVSYNKARLPTPAQWVNIERIRVKDAYTHVWWMSRTDRPYANNRRVLRPYSDAMKYLLKRGKYNAGRRPSEHVIGERSFLRDNHGAIPPNVLEVANTRSNDPYMEYCRQNDLPLQPARMPRELPEFFVKFLTKPRNLVLDPFAGSNTTGATAESLGRRWVAIESIREYVEGSMGRFSSVTDHIG